MKLLAAVVVALALAGPAAARCVNPDAVTQLEGEVMCPTCKTTLDQSDAPAANRIRVYIRDRGCAGATDARIKRELVDQFGPAILAEPPKRGFDLLAWWLPLGGIILGAFALAFGVWRWSRTRGGDEAEPAVDPSANGRAQLDPELERRLDDALAHFDS